MNRVEEGLRLTEFSQGGGCSCKVSLEDLEAMIDKVESGVRDEAVEVIPAMGAKLIVGLETGDDGAVVSIGDGLALISTTDFFPPVVDNPREWGMIAAANALSDVYAMGGEPLVALNILSWPQDKLPDDVIAEVLRGGSAIAEEAKCLLAGGHTISTPTPIYGLAVTGVAHTGKLLRNDCARAGDPISLTKPLGTGILSNLHKRTGASIDNAIATMVQLNASASRLAVDGGIRAATDVTGFGLLGHLIKMARASGVSARIERSKVPILEGVMEAAERGYIPGGTRRNLEFARRHVTAELDELEMLVLADAQTSGGLLVAGELPGFEIIGEFVERNDAQVFVA